MTLLSPILLYGGITVFLIGALIYYCMVVGFAAVHSTRELTGPYSEELRRRLDLALTDAMREQIRRTGGITPDALKTGLCPDALNPFHSMSIRNHYLLERHNYDQLLNDLMEAVALFSAESFPAARQTAVIMIWRRQMERNLPDALAQLVEKGPAPYQELPAPEQYRPAWRAAHEALTVMTAHSLQDTPNYPYAVWYRDRIEFLRKERVESYLSAGELCPEVLDAQCHAEQQQKLEQWAQIASALQISEDAVTTSRIYGDHLFHDLRFYYPYPTVTDLVGEYERSIRSAEMALEAADALGLGSLPGYRELAATHTLLLSGYRQAAEAEKILRPAGPKPPPPKKRRLRAPRPKKEASP